MEWFQCTVKYEREMENGSLKKVSEPYLVDAINFTEAEKRIIEERAPYMTGPYEVSDIKKARFAELFETADDSADRFFKAKIAYITYDEKSGKEKRTTQQTLVQAADFRDALKRLDEGMKGAMGDYSIITITETPIIDIYHYQKSAPQAKAEI